MLSAIMGMDKNGAQRPVLVDPNRAILSTDRHARYYDAVREGRVYHAAMQAGAAFGTALTTTAVTLTLYNPIGSGVELALWDVTVGITTGQTSGTSVLVLATNDDPTLAAVVETTGAVIRNSRLGLSNGRGHCLRAATLPAAPVVARVLGMGEFVGTATSFGVSVIHDDVAGAIVLPENTAVTLQSIGIAHSGICAFTWEEIPV